MGMIGDFEFHLPIDVIEIPPPHPMSLRLRLLLLMLVVYCGGGYFLIRQGLEEIRPRYLESMEETLVDTSVLLASVLETQLVDGRLDPGGLERALGAAQGRRSRAHIFSLTKTEVDTRVYVTDATGLVVYDSSGLDPGRDYSQWNDVKRTLQGRYGARSTRAVVDDDGSQVIYVAAPILRGDQIVGVLSVGKPTEGVNQLVEAARERLLVGAVLGGLLILVGLLLAAAWVVGPLERLTAYARVVRDGGRAPLPTLPGHTLADLGAALEQMREALDGRQRVERYTQVLAHEVKSPLAAIRGAAELLDESMPVEQRARFLANIRREVDRIHLIVERLLELSSLEARKDLQQVETIPASTLAAEAAAVVGPPVPGREIAIQVEAGPAHLHVVGERVLLREALVNLLQNAAAFSPPGSTVTLRVVGEGRWVDFVVEDDGTGIPDYALPRIFERFYSLPRSAGGHKSTGLGLTLVQEIAHLHGGEVAVANRPAAGTRACLRLPSLS